MTREPVSHAPAAGAPRLGVVMIVKNEEGNIGTLLEDLEGVADEIVVVDTGSSDRTVEILNSFGVTVGFFDWCDDFSAARNASIELASSEYLMWLDADDRIDAEARESLLKLKASLPPDRGNAYSLRVLNTAQDFTDTMGLQVRIFPNLPGVRFEGRLHEQITPSLSRVPGMRIVGADITVRHTGYFHEEDVEAKGRRNLAIQLKEIEDGNDSARQYFYVAMSCHAMKDFERCLEYIEKARGKARDENWYRYSFNLSTECHMKLGRVEKALQEARQGAGAFPESGTMHYNLGAVCLKAGDYPGCVEALEKASRLGIEVDAFPTPPHIRTTLPYYLGTALEHLGKRKEAINAYRASVETNPEWGPALKSLGLSLVQSGEVEEGAACLEKAKAATQGFDLQLSLALAKVCLYRNRIAEAHGLYAETAENAPGRRDVLAGLILTSIAVDDVDRLLSALDGIMQELGMDTDREIGSISEMAGLCAETGSRLLEDGDAATARKLLDAALSLDEACAFVHLAFSDLEKAEGRISQALAHLEKALENGARPEEVEARVKGLEKASS